MSYSRRRCYLFWYLGICAVFCMCVYTRPRYNTDGRMDGHRVCCCQKGRIGVRQLTRPAPHCCLLRSSNAYCYVYWRLVRLPACIVIYKCVVCECVWWTKDSWNRAGVAVAATIFECRVWLLFYCSSNSECPVAPEQHERFASFCMWFVCLACLREHAVCLKNGLFISLTCVFCIVCMLPLRQQINKRDKNK